MVREKISEALKSGDNRQLDDAVKDWLAGITTDEELAERYERDRESFNSGPSGISRQLRHGRTDSP